MGIFGSSDPPPSVHERYKAGSPAALAWFRRPLDGGDKPADCFYLHPTTALGLFSYNTEWDNYATGEQLTGMAAGTPDLWETQAGCMEASCNVWAPRYSQVGLAGLGAATPDQSEAKLAAFVEALAVATEDAKAAFTAFLEERPDPARPFVVLAHSQGSIVMTKLIQQVLVGHAQQPRFVAAYLAGGYIPTDLVPQLGGEIHVCSGPTDSNCIISYDTRTKALWEPAGLHAGMLALWPHLLYYHYFDKYCDHPADVKDPESKPRVQVNPLSWKSVGGPGSGYLGAKQFGHADPVLPADEAWGAAVSVSDHCLWVDDPRPWLHNNDAGPAAGDGNLHPVDVSLWHYNIQANVAERLSAFT